MNMKLKSSPSNITAQFAFTLGVGFILFTLLMIQLFNGRFAHVDLLPDQGATWYYWKLATPTFWSMTTAWGGYLLHQLFMWWTIVYAKRSNLSYTNGLHRVNYIALAGNVAFIGLHFLQTQIWYDGLAQNVSLTSSEVSVILLLVIVLLMENKRRGLFFGRKVPISDAVTDFFRHNHGYIFAWAIVYTFWFHPMVATSGHLMGFLYIFMLILQSSLMYTRQHLNRSWRVSLEIMVLIHGAMVVYMLGSSALWAFILGFLGIFVITQLHGLRVNRHVKTLAILFYLCMIVVGYVVNDGYVLRDIVLVPLIEYGSVIILAGITWLGIQGYRLVAPDN